MTEDIVEKARLAGDAWELYLEDILNGKRERGTGHLAFVPFLLKEREDQRERDAKIVEQESRDFELASQQTAFRDKPELVGALQSWKPIFADLAKRIREGS